MRLSVPSQVYVGLDCSSRTSAVYLVRIRPGWSPKQTYNAQVLPKRPKAFSLSQVKTLRPRAGKL